MFSRRFPIVIAGWTITLTMINFLDSHKLIYSNLVQRFDVGISVWTLSILPLSMLAAYLLGDAKQATIAFPIVFLSSSLLLYILLTLPIQLGIIVRGAPILQTQSVLLVGFRAIFSLAFSIFGIVVGGLIGER